MIVREGEPEPVTVLLADVVREPVIVRASVYVRVPVTVSVAVPRPTEGFVPSAMDVEAATTQCVAVLLIVQVPEFFAPVSV